MSLNFHQRTPNEEDQHRHLRLDLHFIPIINRLLHHHNARRHTSDRHTRSFRFPSRLFASTRASKLHSVVDGCTRFRGSHALFERLYYSYVFQSLLCRFAFWSCTMKCWSRTRLPLSIFHDIPRTSRFILSLSLVALPLFGLPPYPTSCFLLPS